MEDNKKIFGINVSYIRYYYTQKYNDYDAIEIVWNRSSSSGSNLTLKFPKESKKILNDKFINCISNSMNLKNAFINFITDDNWFIYDIFLSDKIELPD